MDNAKIKSLENEIKVQANKFKLSLAYKEE